MNPTPTNPTGNICFFKPVCKQCEIVEMNDRPRMCSDMKCKDYTPCRRCKKNKTLNSQGICHNCANSNDEKSLKVGVPPVKEGLFLSQQLQNPPPGLQPGLVNMGMESFAGGGGSGSEDGTATRVPISLPGTPPSGYNDSEKQYYQNQWTSYIGYYRDPTAAVMVHQIIVMEIELQQTTSMFIRCVGDRKAELQKHVDNITDTLSTLRKQLPKKEADVQSDYEKNMSVIYDKWLKEKENRRKGGITRIFSQDAIALAPNLFFPVDPSEILQRLGYTLVESLEACQMLKNHGKIPTDPLEMAKFFGFPLDEELAGEDVDASAEIKAASLEDPDIDDEEVDAPVTEDED